MQILSVYREKIFPECLSEECISYNIIIPKTKTNLENILPIKSLIKEVEHCI